jgi:p-hydroxybenzoate 3-monooxygenase
VVLESRTREYVEYRQRAGMLEQGTVDALREAGAADRLDVEGLVHQGIELRFDRERHHIDFPALTGGRTVTIYAQTEIVKDLVALQLADGPPLLFEAEAIAVDGPDGDTKEVAPLPSGLSVSRPYLQVPADTDPDDWPDDRIWDELDARFAVDGDRTLRRGPITAKSVTAMRSYVHEPMRYGRLLLAGDAAHIVPPTGAKGLNLAVSDIRLLSRALIGLYRSGIGQLLGRHSQLCLQRVWQAPRFSDDMTRMLHAQPNGDAFENRLQLARLRRITASRHAAAELAANYSGLPLPE